jgi:hypothetical protein
MLLQSQNTLSDALSNLSGFADSYKIGGYLTAA